MGWKAINNQEINPLTNKLGKWLGIQCPSCKGCRVRKKCVKLWDYMALNPLDKEDYETYKSLFTQLIEGNYDR